MKTIILGDKNETQKVFDALIYNDDDDVRTICKSRCCTYCIFKNGDTIRCFIKNESVRGYICDVLYVPSTMSVEDVYKYKTSLSHRQDIEVVVYRINKTQKTTLSNRLIVKG